MTSGASLTDAKKAKAKAAGVFKPLVGEVAVGLVRLDEDSYGLKVNLTNEPEEQAQLPTEIDGVPVQVAVVGKIRKR